MGSGLMFSTAKHCRGLTLRGLYPPAQPLLHSPALHQLFLTSNLTSSPVLQFQCSGVLPPPSLCPPISFSVNTAGLNSRGLRCGLTLREIKAYNPAVSNSSEIQTYTVRHIMAFFRPMTWRFPKTFMNL